MATLKNDPNAKDTITTGTDVGGGSATPPAMGSPATPAAPAANKAQTGRGFVNLQNYMSAAKPGQVEAMGARAAQGLGAAIGGVKTGVDQANTEFGKSVKDASGSIYAPRTAGQQIGYSGPANLQGTAGYQLAMGAQDAGNTAATKLGSASGQGTELAAAYGTKGGASALNQSLVNANQGAQQAIKAQTDAWGGLKDYISGANTAATSQADAMKAQAEARNAETLKFKQMQDAQATKDFQDARVLKQNEIDRQKILAANPQPVAPVAAPAPAQDLQARLDALSNINPRTGVATPQMPTLDPREQLSRAVAPKATKKIGSQT